VRLLRLSTPVASLLVVVAFALLSFPLLRPASGDNVTSTIQIGSSRIDIVEEGGSFAVAQEDLMDWIRRAAQAVVTYYGRYPVAHVMLRVVPFEGRGVRGGKTFGAEGGGRIRIHVGTETTAANLKKDWMLTHEMVHLSFPSVADNHHWIEEGIATYVEPIARVRAKQLDAAEMWFEVVRDLPQGLPDTDDRGLDHTHTWGRTYWGGALFCLLADVEIHKATQNKEGLEDALRAILDAGGDIRQDWKLEKALQVGDQATGTEALERLYAEMKDRPYPVDLADLWKQLGVVKEGDTVRVNTRAPLAATLQAITYGSALTPQSSFPPFAAFVGRTAKAPR
jgi:hypothetical protein